MDSGQDAIIESHITGLFEALIPRMFGVYIALQRLNIAQELKEKEIMPALNVLGKLGMEGFFNQEKMIQFSRVDKRGLVTKIDRFARSLDSLIKVMVVNTPVHDEESTHAIMDAVSLRIAVADEPLPESYKLFPENMRELAQNFFHEAAAKYREAFPRGSLMDMLNSTYERRM